MTEGSSNHLPDLFFRGVGALLCKPFFFFFQLARYQVDARGKSNGLRTRPIWPARLQPERPTRRLGLHAEQLLSFSERLSETRATRVPPRGRIRVTHGWRTNGSADGGGELQNEHSLHLKCELQTVIVFFCFFVFFDSVVF